MSYVYNIQPICDAPIDGGMSTGGGLRLCCNPRHALESPGRPVWHDGREWYESQTKKGNAMGVLANFRIVERTTKSLLIRDIGPWSKYSTITNDAENVVEQLVRQGELTGRRLFYFDSEGDLDELLIKDGKFAGFAPAIGVP